jgi:hypothetical protein
MENKHNLQFKTQNGRVKIYVDGIVMFAFNQIDYAGHYAYKDDTNLYGLDIYLLRQGAGQGQMEIYFKTKEHWLNIIKLLDDNM